MDIRNRLRDIEEFLHESYREGKKDKKRDWRTYEQKLMNRIKTAVKNLEPLVDKAACFEIRKGKGRKKKLSLKQSVILLLLKEMFGKSNRMMASMLTIFSLPSGIDVSYKTVERLYSDPEVEMAIYNLHILILKKKGIREVDASGDGTGYSITIKKHYASETQKRKEKAKNSSGKDFVYSFKLMDLKTKMYIAYGTSLNIARFGDAKVYIIPRKNATIRGSWKWKETMKDFVKNTVPYLEQYYLRNNSESGFSADKRWFGWKVGQKREDRIETALSCINVWHNLLNLGQV